MSKCKKCRTHRCNCKVVINKPVEIITKGRGRDGLDAYELAVLEGFIGTREEWFESLHGKDGGTYLADEEDITVDENLEMKFKDREYEDGGGLGYKILRLGADNIITSSDFEANTVHEIRYDFDLDGETIEMPENVVLKFNGGSLSNGTIQGNQTKIESSLTKIFGDGVDFTGKFSVPIIFPEWFGAIGYPMEQVASDFWWTTDDNRLGGLISGVDSTKAINESIKLSTISGGKTVLSGGQYKTTDTVVLPSKHAVLEIYTESALRPIIHGAGNVINTYPKEGPATLPDMREEFNEQQVALLSNQAFATDCMGVAIRMYVGSQVIGSGYISLGNSSYTIGIYIEGAGFGTIDMIYNTRVDVKIVGGSTNRVAPAPYDIMMDGWDNSVGEIGDYGFNTQSGEIRRKTSNGWTTFYANKSEYNTLIRTECNGNDIRLINLKISIWGILGFRGIEMLCNDGGWNNQSVWEGTISNISNSFITISSGHSTHDMSTMTYQIGNKHSPESRVVALFGGSNGFTFGNTWDITWFKPPRLGIAYEFSRGSRSIRMVDVDVGSSDGMSYWDFKGDPLRSDLQYVAHDAKKNLISDSYSLLLRNLKKYRSFGGGLSSSRSLRKETFNKTEVESLSPLDVYTLTMRDYTAQEVTDGEVQLMDTCVYDENYDKRVKVIDTDNNLYGTSTVLFKNNNRDAGNYLVVVELRVNKMESDCWVSFPVNSSSDVLQSNRFLIHDQTGPLSSRHNLISRVFCQIYVSNRDLLRVSTIYFHTKGVADIDLYNIKVFSDGGASMDINNNSGPTNNRPDACPKGWTYFDTTINAPVINVGDSSNQVWKRLLTEDDE